MPEQIIFRDFVPTLRAIDEAKRQITFTASTPTIDRYGDSISVGGWDFSAYKKNPVVLFGHDSSQPPVAKTVEIHTERNPDALVHTAEFAPASASPFADQIYQLYKGKFLNSVSVGFRPTQPPKRLLDQDDQWTGGYQFDGQELLEISCVPIPANTDAVARAIHKGIISGESVERFFRALAPATERDAPRVELAAAFAAVTKLEQHAEAIVQRALAREAVLLDCIEYLLDVFELPLIQTLFAANKKISNTEDLERLLIGAHVNQEINSAEKLERVLRGGAN
jgi:HK97 family phage prohead protease